MVNVMPKEMMDLELQLFMPVREGVKVDDAREALLRKSLKVVGTTNNSVLVRASMSQLQEMFNLSYRQLTGPDRWVLAGQPVIPADLPQIADFSLPTNY